MKQALRTRLAYTVESKLWFFMMILCEESENGRHETRDKRGEMRRVNIWLLFDGSSSRLLVPPVSQGHPEHWAHTGGQHKHLNCIFVIFSPQLDTKCNQTWFKHIIFHNKTLSLDLWKPHWHSKLGFSRLKWHHWDGNKWIELSMSLDEIGEPYLGGL